MIDILLVVFFLSLLALAFGMYNPKNVKMTSRRGVVKFVGPIIAVLLLLVLVVV